MEEIIYYFLSFFCGVFPPILWLSFYLKEDQRPEPKRMVIFVFLLGVLFVFPAVSFQFLLLNIFSSFNSNPFSFFWFFQNFFIVAFLEEFFKFLPIVFFVFKNKEFDEPVDAMIYMIISALGFAACENFFAIKNVDPNQFNISEYYFSSVFLLASLRFLGPVFLHSLSSAIFGYFVSLYYFKKGNVLTLLVGLLLATLLHFVFNFSIIVITKEKTLPFHSYVAVIVFLGFVGWLVHQLFQRLKNKK
jgi:RsiW-degrading membrane proteinase PrsW (M82 family)